MKYLFDSYNHIICLQKGERLSECLETFFASAETEINGGWISGVGGALEVELGYYNLDTQEYTWKKFNQTLEVLNLQGSVALNEQGKPMFHLHGTFGDSEFKTVGGHVKDLVVGGTLELFFHRTYLPLKRKLNPEVGLQTLDLHDSAN